MKKLLQTTCALLAFGLFAAACGNNNSAQPEPAKTGAPATAPATAPKPPTSAGGGQFAATPAKTDNPTPVQPTAAAPSQKGYPREAIKAIPDNCASPVVLLSTAPLSAGDDNPWTITHQTFLANQQLHVVSGDPAAPGEVHLATYKYNDKAYALVAKCKDGGTCNDVAAMYKAVVRSSSPQLVCGKMNGLSASPVGSFKWASDPKQNLPADLIGKCARLSACMISTDQSTPGDPFLECQKGPTSFKTECATRYPCSEVLACAGK